MLGLRVGSRHGRRARHGTHHHQIQAGKSARAIAFVFHENAGVFTDVGLHPIEQALPGAYLWARENHITVVVVFVPMGRLSRFLQGKGAG